jgi:hypothetical protein
MKDVRDEYRAIGIPHRRALTLLSVMKKRTRNRQSMRWREPILSLTISNPRAFPRLMAPITLCLTL